MIMSLSCHHDDIKHGYLGVRVNADGSSFILDSLDYNECMQPPDFVQCITELTYINISLICIL